MLVRGALALSVAVAALAVPAARGDGGACAATDGGVRVAVVVDFGDRTTTTCVEVPDRATGAQVLAARAAALGTPPPRWHGAFLCAIDGIPETGCGDDPTADRYWSYWVGDTGTWAYANVGAASRRVRQGSVDGWRLQTGVEEAGNDPPRTSASFASLCPAPPPAPAPAAPPPAPGGPRPAAPAPAGPAASAPTTALPPAGVTTVATATTAAPAATEPDPAPSTTAAAGEVGLAASARRDRGSDGGFPTGLVFGGVLVAGLGAAAAARARRRSP